MVSSDFYFLLAAMPRKSCFASPSNSEVHALKAEGKGRAYYLLKK